MLTIYPVAPTIATLNPDGSPQAVLGNQLVCPVDHVFANQASIVAKARTADVTATVLVLLGCFTTKYTPSISSGCSSAPIGCAPVNLASFSKINPLYWLGVLALADARAAYQPPPPKNLPPPAPPWPPQSSLNFDGQIPAGAVRLVVDVDSAQQLFGITL